MGPLQQPCGCQVGDSGRTLRGFFRNALRKERRLREHTGQTTNLAGMRFCRTGHIEKGTSCCLAVC